MKLKELLYYSALQVSFHSDSEPKALWVVVMHTMNNQTYNATRVCDSGTYKALYLSCLGAKDTTQCLWETF